MPISIDKERLPIGEQLYSEIEKVLRHLEATMVPLGYELQLKYGNYERDLMLTITRRDASGRPYYRALLMLHEEVATAFSNGKPMRYTAANIVFNEDALNEFIRQVELAAAEAAKLTGQAVTAH